MLHFIRALSGICAATYKMMERHWSLFQTWRIRDVDLPNVGVILLLFILLLVLTFDGHDGVDDGAVGQEVDDGLRIVLETIFGVAKESAETLDRQRQSLL